MAKHEVRQIEFDLQPKQEDLLNLLEVPGVVNIGYGGPRGGGKSRGIRDCMLIRRLKYRGTTGWLVRRTFDEVYENHVKKYFTERPYMRQWYNTTRKTITLPNGSEIIFRHAEHEDDLEKEYGKEAMDIFVDQGEQFTEKEMNFIRTCRRSPGVPNGLCKLVSTINPGGRGHAYNKRVYIERQFIDKEDPASFGFIRASGWDNVEWVMEALRADGFSVLDFYSWPDDRRFEYYVTRSQYGRDLATLPEKERKQQLYGDFDFFEGQVFGELSERLHNIDSYFNVNDEIMWNDFHKGMRIIGSLDHASTGITTYGPTGIDVDGNQFQLEEYYKANMLISEHADAIKLLKARYNRPDYEVIDPSTEAKTLQSAHVDNAGNNKLFSVQQAYAENGLHFRLAHRFSIAVGIDRIKQLLKVDPHHRNPFTQELGSPHFFISRSRCPMLWKEMTDLQIVDGEFIGSDHGIDRVRYVAMSRPLPATLQPKPHEPPKPAGVPEKGQRTHDSWAKKFDKHIENNKGEGSYW